MVKHSETAKGVKQNIEGGEGILVSQQHLKFGEVNMEDGSTLASFNILRGSTLELIKVQTQTMVSVQKRKREEEFICIDFVKELEHLERLNSNSLLILTPWLRTRNPGSSLQIFKGSEGP